MILGFTGTRRGMTDNQKSVIRAFLGTEPVTVVHGGACKGADQDMFLLSTSKDHVFWPSQISQWNWAKKVARPDDVVKPIFPPLVRNKYIVAHAEVMIVIPKGFAEELRSGTWATYRYAMRERVKTLVVWPNGTSNWR